LLHKFSSALMTNPHSNHPTMCNPITRTSLVPRDHPFATCTCPLIYGRARRCGFGGRGVTNGIRADLRGCAYGSVCRHRAHGACWPEIKHTACHMGWHWTYGCALRGKVPGHLLGSVYGHMHARVGLGWGTQHGVWVGTGGVSWTDEDIGFFEGG
jgi:hypothetical protein